MKIYINDLSLSTESQYRGIGFYTKHLISSLKKDKVNIVFFRDEKEIKDNPKTTIVHYPSISPYFLNVPAKKRFKRVITVHDLIPIKFPHLYPAGIRGKLLWKINKFIIKNTDAIITDSLTSKNDILRFCWGIDTKKIHIIPLASDSFLKPLKKSQWPHALGDFKNNLKDFILYVGDINPSKNLPILLKACLDLKIPLILVGKKIIADNYDKKHTENKDLVFVQKMIKKHPKLFKALGFINKEDLLSLYNLTTLYCQPSLEEGFGLPVLEAMSCACPVVVSQTSALLEITKNNAFLFDPNSLDSLKTTLKTALKDKEKRKKLAILGFKRAKDFSWQKTAQKTLKVYKKL